jgi:hypothetical protein
MRTKSGSMFVFRGVRNRVRRTRRTGFATKANHWLSARCTIAKEQKVRPQHCAVLCMLRASPGWPSLATRRTHAFDPWTDSQRPGKQMRSTQTQADSPAPQATTSVGLRAHSGDCPVSNKQQPQPSDDRSVQAHSGEFRALSQKTQIRCFHRPCRSSCEQRRFGTMI